MKNSDGKLLWLESGNSKGGYAHILSEHTADWRGRRVGDIVAILEDVVTSSSPYNSGRNAKGPFADYSYGGKNYR